MIYSLVFNNEPGLKKPFKITVSSDLVSDSYEILIGKDISTAAREIRSVYSGHKIFVLTDSNVRKYYGTIFSDKRWHTIAIPPGERSKSRRSKEIIENYLLTRGAARDSIIVAVGGGMIGDLAGFTASTFMRGIRYIHIPTTLISQVDSSIGGKVAVNHPLGKNLIGAFHRPVKVFIDIKTLKTLPEREFRQGMAEVIKHAVTLDKKLFNFLETHRNQIMRRDEKILLHIISRCVELKKYVVEKDERENNFRRILNFGHTIGHALESYQRYKLHHGEAVAIGMSVESDIAFKLGLLDHESILRLTALISLYNLPTKLPRGISLPRIIKLTSLDKKSFGNLVHYTLPMEIGKASWDVALSNKSVLKALMK